MAKDFAALSRLEAETGALVQSVERDQQRFSAFANAWDKRTARRAVKGGVGLTLALSLAACGGSDSDPVVDTTTTYTLGDLLAAITAQNLAAEYGLKVESADIAVSLEELALVSAAVDSATNGDEYQAAVEAGEITIDVTVTDEVVTLDVADFADLANLGVTFSGAVSVEDTAEALLASDADFGDAAIVVTDEALTVSVADAEALLALGAQMAEGSTVTVADTAEALLASDADFGDAAIVVTDEALTLDVADFAALADLGATYEAAPSVQDSLENVDGAVLDGIVDLIVDVAGETPNADLDLAAVVDATGTGEVTFDFADADDVVTLTGSLSGFSAVNVRFGTVDLTGVALSDSITAINVSSGVIMTAEQFLALEDGVTGGSADSEVTVIVSTQEEADAVVAAFANIKGTLDGNNFVIEAAADAAEGLDIAQANTDLGAAIIEAGIDGALPGALQALAAADAEVVGQEAIIADFLEAAFANEFVAVLADDDRNGELNGAEVVEEADIANAYVGAADAISNNEGAAFNGLTSAQQSVRIADLRGELQGNVAIAEADRDAVADQLEDGVIALIDVAEAAAAEYTQALDDFDAALAAVDLSAVAAGAVADVNREVAVDFEIVAGRFGIEAGAVGFDPVALVQIDLDTNAVSISEAVTVVENGDYQFAFEREEGDPPQPVQAFVTIDKEFFDDLLVKYQALVDADSAELDADEALTLAVHDVLVAQGAIQEEDLLDASVISVGQDNSVTIDYDGEFEGAAVYGAATPIVEYIAAEGAVVNAETALSEFNAAVTAWEATGDLVDGLAALNATLADLEAAVTAAEGAIINPTDAAEDPGLGLNLVAADLGVVTFDAAGDAALDDVYVFSADDAVGAIRVRDFAADGTDRLFFGEGYTLVEMAADETTADALGDVSTLEIFVEETDVGVTLYVEGIPSAGTGSGVDDLTQIDIAGVTLDTLSFDDASGILSATAALV